MRNRRERSAVTRHVNRLGPRGKHRGYKFVEGLGLIQKYEDPKDFRRHLLEISPKGRMLVDEIRKRSR